MKRIPRHWRLALTVATVAVLGALATARWWADLFGPGTWGTGGNLVAWVLCGALSFGWLHAQDKARHLALVALAERHHADRLALAAHHHEDLKRHITATASPPER